MSDMQQDFSYDTAGAADDDEAVLTSAAAPSSVTNTAGSEIMSYDPEESSQLSQLSQDVSQLSQDVDLDDENDSQQEQNLLPEHQQQQRGGGGQSRIATSQLDNAHGPPKRPRLSLEDGNGEGHFLPYAQHPPQYDLEPQNQQLQNQQNINNLHQHYPPEDDECSAAWSLRPLAPNGMHGGNGHGDGSGGPGPMSLVGTEPTNLLLEGAEFEFEKEEEEGSITSHSSNSSIAGSHGTDRWRTRHVSSFSSTLTEHSRYSGDEEGSSSEAEDPQQQPSQQQQQQQQPSHPQFVNFPPNPAVEDEEILPEYTTTTHPSSSSSFTDNNSNTMQPPSQIPINTNANTNTNNNNNNSVEQLTNRLDHWCSITNMRALQQRRRNNIYHGGEPEQQTKSQKYNPNGEYDYSNVHLSRKLRKLQCKSAKQEVMRALQQQRDRDIRENDDNTTPTTNNRDGASNPPPPPPSNDVAATSAQVVAPSSTTDNNSSENAFSSNMTI